jgi:ribosomal protein S17E
MSNLSNAFGKKFNPDTIRTRSFEFNGHTFKLKIPLSGEYEDLLKNTQIVDDTKVNEYYNELTKDFVANKEVLNDKQGVVFKDDDIEIQGRSMRETAKNKLITENRILAMIKLLVPEEKDFDMTSITYEMVDELFPFNVQLELVEEIGNVISPTYKASKGK